MLILTRKYGESLVIGWYDMEMVYFNRKGTATLELFWRPPWDKGEGDMAHVPRDLISLVMDGMRPRPRPDVDSKQ